MKNSIFSFIALAIFTLGSITISAQVEEREALMSLGDQNAITIDIDNVDKKKLEGYFRSYFKSYGKIKFNRKANEFYMENAKVKTISKEKLNLYIKLQEVDRSGRIYLWIDNGLSFVNSEETVMEFTGAEKLLSDFGLFVESSLIEEELKEAEKNLAKMERDQKILVKDNEKYHKAVEEAQKKIAEMEIAIEENVVKQANKASEIEIHKAGIEEVKMKLEQVGKN